MVPAESRNEVAERCTRGLKGGLAWSATGFSLAGALVMVPAACDALPHRRPRGDHLPGPVHTLVPIHGPRPPREFHRAPEPALLIDRLPGLIYHNAASPAACLSPLRCREYGRVPRGSGGGARLLLCRRVAFPAPCCALIAPNL